MRLNIINDFNNYMESKEKERLLNEEMMRKKQIEEEELIKLRGRSIEIISQQEVREKQILKNLNEHRESLRDLLNNTTQSNTLVTGVLEIEERE